MPATRRSKSVIWVTVVLAVVMATAPMSAATTNSNTSQENQPVYWEQQGYGTCFKIEGPSTPFVMPSPPGGSQWTALIVKSGSEASTSEPHQVVDSPRAGSPYAHSSGKSISHVILCYAVGGTTSTTSTTTTSTPGSTTTIAPGCDDSYTPRNITATPQKVNPGQAITVSGAGLPGSTILITLRRPNGTIIDPGVSVVVPPSGLWSVVVPIPQTAPLGSYNVVATVDGCPRATASTRIVVNNGKNASVGGTGAADAPPPTAPPVVKGANISQSSLPTNMPVSVAALGVGAVLLMMLRTKRSLKRRG